MDADYEVISWQRITKDVDALANQLASQQRFDNWLIVARGGLAPASLLLRYLPPVPRLSVMHLSLRHGSQISFPFGADYNQHWLVIDDLVDTGQTIKDIKVFFPNIKVAVLYAKPAGKPYADFFVREYPQDTYLVFPWEVDDPRVHSPS